MSRNVLGVYCLMMMVFLVSGCASQTSLPYQELASASQLHGSDQDESGRTPLQYTTTVNWHQYKTVIVEPVILYGGPDNAFSDLTITEAMLLKKDMETQVRKSLATHFRVSTRLGGEPAAIRVRVTLLGAEKNTPLLTTFSRFDIGMGSYNLIQSMRDKRGTFSGSVYFAVEVYDDADSRLLTSYVTQQYPTVYDISATRGALSAAQAGIARGAQDLARKLSTH